MAQRSRLLSSMAQSLMSIACNFSVAVLIIIPPLFKSV